MIKRFSVNLQSAGLLLPEIKTRDIPLDADLPLYDFRDKQIITALESGIGEETLPYLYMIPLYLPLSISIEAHLSPSRDTNLYFSVILKTPLNFQILSLRIFR